MSQGIRSIFEREIGVIVSIWRSLRRLWRRSGRRPRLRLARRALATRTPPRLARLERARATAPRPSRLARWKERGGRRSRPGWLGSRHLTAVLASLAFHLGLVVFLLSFPEDRPRRAGPAREITVAFRLLPPPSPSEPPPAPERDEEPSRVEPDPATTQGPLVARPQEPAAAAAGSETPPTEVATPPTPPVAPAPVELAAIGLGGGGPPPLPSGAIRTQRPAANGLLGHRLEGRAAALERYGGGATTENAVERGLRWLAAHQDDDGGWDADGFTRHCRGATPCGGRGFAEHDVGVTSLALLAFLGAGHGPRHDGPYRLHVKRGLDYLVDARNAAGSFGSESRNYLYGHALATFALAEAYAMTGRRIYRECAETALGFSRAAQQPGGGWDYTSHSPEGRNDLSITAWQIMAIRSADKAGIELPAGLQKGVLRYMGRAFTPTGEGIYADRGMGEGRRGINMVAVGLLGFLYTGGRQDATRARLAVDRLMRYHNLPERESLRHWDRTFQSYYYWYAATLCLFHLAEIHPQVWDAWNSRMKTTLLPMQDDEPHAGGSWAPEPSWIGASGGRVYATAINVLTLEVYYRYTPLYGIRR